MAAGDGNPGDSELEAGLQRLFSDDRLSIRPSPEAGQAIVAGARRGRRRREFTLIGGGSAAVVLVLVAGVMLAGPPHGGDGDSVASPRGTSELRPEQPTMLPPASATADAPPVPNAERGELSPYGYGKLKLGMSFKDLKDSGLLADP
ncbi:MAG: hypothetical protein GEU86_14605, partial [Actinophytocola sp.]|nr:hypothetical protein [Actinophytocola sp.]